MRIPAVLAVAVLLSACGGGDQPADEAPPQTADSQATTAETTDDPATTTADAVVLEADGLQAQGSLSFDDADQETVTGAVEAVLDRAPTSQEPQMECGPGMLDAVSWDGLDLYFSDGTFAGWYLQEPQPAGVDVAGGAGLGDTAQDLEAAFGDVMVEESTLGTEFSAGDISGTLSGADDSGTVDVMWAGATCIAR